MFLAATWSDFSAIDTPGRLYLAIPLNEDARGSVHHNFGDARVFDQSLDRPQKR